MNFKDFQDNYEELIGKTVLYESGQTYNRYRNLSIHKIEKVTKTGFRISNHPDYLFSFIDGYRKGLNGRMDIGTISKCTIITDEEANQLRQQWKRNKEERDLRQKMQEKLKTMTFEQLKKMELL